jgi:succinoglycan biosynthesis protein ExoM
MLKGEVPEFKKPVEFVLLSICTCQRPNMLRDCLLSANLLKVPDSIKVEILVIDNDENQTAKNVVETVKNDVKFPIHYEVENERGLAKARNKMLEEAIKIGASHILCIDDDEICTEDVLEQHIKTYNENSNAVIISGRTINKFDESYPNYIKNHMVFKQKTSKKTGLVRDNCAAGNVFFPITLVKDYNLRFSEKYKFMGGEDGEFFNRASKLGFVIVWCNESIIYEVVPPARANMKYILEKCYYNGYSGAFGRFKTSQNPTKRFFYGLKNFLVLIFDVITLFPSLLFGISAFCNALGRCFRTAGKINASFKNIPLNFYEKIYGE